MLMAVEQDFGTRPDFDQCSECETSLQRVVEMIAQQCAPEEILTALCGQTGPSAGERQVAFFRFDGEDWSVAARGELTSGSQARLARIDPGALSEAVASWSTAAGTSSGFAFDSGWACHLYSGTGELLGMFVRLADGPVQPAGFHASRIESVCRLATLAVEQRNLLDELTHQADHDTLTGLYNRSYYERVLGWALKDRGPDEQCALLYVNLDRFRLVNDVLGHSIGNRLLGLVGRRLASRLHPEDLLARAGGDEFAVLLPRVRAVADATAAAALLLQSLEEPFSVDGHTIFVNASIGIGCSGSNGGAESLEREAYIALYHAKHTVRGRAILFDSAMAFTPPERLETEKRLRFALDRKELLLYYQPQVELCSGRVCGAEVLLRWRPEGLGIVSPAVFIPVLEETGLIVDFGRWVLREACRQGREWGLPLRLGVNVSALQFARREFREDVEQALADTGFPPGRLELELTESLFVADFAGTSALFQDLHKLGISFALDDFGTGQSSLSYLQKLPFQRLKIDQAFIRPIGDHEACPPLVVNIVQMAQTLRMTTIAEGIETGHQAQLLQAACCDEGQGYFFSKPLPAAEFEDYCRRRGIGPKR